MKKNIVLAAGLLILIILSITLKKPIVSDALKFKEEYKKIEITEDNLFKYVDYEKVNTILNGTGIIYLGNPENKLSLKMVSILDKVSQEYQVDINYLNTKEITKKQEKELNKKIEKFSTKEPIVIFVKKGKIIKTHSYKDEDEKQVTELYSDYVNETFDIACTETC